MSDQRRATRKKKNKKESGMRRSMMWVGLALVGAVGLVGCDGGSEGGSATSAGSGAVSSGGSTESPAWMLASAPADAVGVASAKGSAREGETVAVRGIIGGRKDALSTAGALFVMMDTGLDNPCVTAEDDHCPTPWDYCCTPPDQIMANSATVLLVDDAGKTLPLDLRTFGIEPLDEVVVVGTVAARPSADVLTIMATGIHRP